MGKRKLRIVVALLSGVLVVLFQSTASSNPKDLTIANKTLNLEFDLQSGAVNHWRLPGVVNAQGRVKDLAAPARKLFSLEGKLGGKSLREWQSLAGGWKVLERDADALSLVLKHADIPFTIKKTWRLIGQPWRVGFQLSLTSCGLFPTGGDGLWLHVGPGIGEVPVQGLGIGQSIYNFTELVYHDGKGVKTLRLGRDKEVQSFKSKEGAPIDWFGLQSRYFTLILAPVDAMAHELSWISIVPDSPHWHTGHADLETSLKIALPLLDLNSEQTLQWTWQVFGGGKTYTALSEGAPDLGRLLFSGLWDWMRALTLGIMHVLNFIHGWVKNWGVAIILLAVLVRVVMHPVAKKTMVAQKKYTAIQEKIQPQIQEIRRNYKGGEQSERILRLYEHHQVSPLAGLKPLSIVIFQLPIFIALYHLLGQTFELQFAPFLWMRTLAEPDKLFSLGVAIPFFGAYFNLLPMLMAFTTLLSIKLSPSPTTNHAASKRQNIFLGLMALGFFLLFYSFPAGMVLYWLTVNLLQIVHQKMMKI